MRVDQRKFRELLLYVSARSTHDKKFGAIKLNKILFFCDFEAYVRLGKPITGAAYFRLGKGPAPKCLVPVRRELMEQGIIELEHVELKSGKLQDRVVPLRAPNTSVFTGEELELIDRVVATLWDHDAEEVSDLSHNEIGWQVMREKETIPYALAFYSNAPLSEDEIARGQQLAAGRTA